MSLGLGGEGPPPPPSPPAPAPAPAPARAVSSALPALRLAVARSARPFQLESHSAAEALHLGAEAFRLLYLRQSRLQLFLALL